MKKLSSIFFCMLITVCCNAQTEGYRYTAPVNKPAQSGFYNIMLTPEMKARLKTDLSDLRIVNNSGKWVPHVLHTPFYEIADDGMLMDMQYTIDQNNGNSTVVTIKSGTEISNLILFIKNTSAQRFCTLSGSDDSQNWFVVNDSILLAPVPIEQGTAAGITIHFPAVNYKFLKLNLLNNNKDPFAITGISSENTVNVKPYFSPPAVPNPPATIQQKDSGNISYIKITQADAYPFNSLNIAFESAKYFSRQTELRIPSTNNIYGTPVQTFTVSNNSPLNFRFTTVKEKVFYLLIHNADNLPLKVSNVQTASEYTFISSYLEKGQSYRLFMDNEAAVAPDYDLGKLKLPGLIDSTPFLQTGNIISIEKKQPAEAAKKDNGKIILWSAIIGILLLLLFFTMKMLKEINKNKSDVHL
ncbi:MAG: hypothetical protein WKF88_09540 [Ferruginibacter sp.]